MKIGICGLGLIGKERVKAIDFISKSTNNEIEFSSVFDINKEILLDVQKKYNVPISNDLNSFFQLKPDWVFIVTPNDVAKYIAQQAFDNGANVLMEKPFGRSLKECDEIISLKPTNLKLNIGFNYRFFSGVEAALNDYRLEKFGKLISVNLILAHGNAPGMEKSWKLDPIKCGDCITDLGVHLFDLTTQLSNNVKINFATSWEGFWNTGVSEEEHWVASDDNGTIFNAQVSYNRWRSNFKLEVNGTEGYGIVEGRGRSYGPQSYRFGKRWGWQIGKPQKETEELIIDNNDCNDSFIKETISILGLENRIKQYKPLQSACNYIEGRNIMCLLEQYKNVTNKIRY